MADRHRVVIIGGGFGGLQAAKALSDAPIDIILIDRRNFHLFQPLLYQVATGGLSPGDIAAPLRWVLRRQKNTRVLMANVTDIDVAGRKVVLEGQDPVAYDTLILAPGAGNFYFGHPEWEQFAPSLKTIEDATEIRSRILSAFEAAEREPDPEKRRAWLTFVIVGGGPTGVELAGTLGEIANDTMRDNFRAIRPEEARIILLDAGARLISSYHPDLSQEAERSLVSLGVRTRSKALVTRVDADGVEFKCGDVPERMASRTVVWAAGVQGSPLAGIVARATGSLPDRGGRIVVNNDCTVPGHPEIFVIGDSAAFNGPDGKPLPGVAPVAMQQGRYVAGAIRARLKGETPKPFHYFHKGSLATIGRHEAVAEFGRIRFGGWMAWLAWLFIHLMYVVGFQNRLLVFIQWAYQYFTYNRGARLITNR